MTTPSHTSLAPGGKPAQVTYPRAYLLSLYNAALEHGHVYATPIAQHDAVRLRQSFYRLRRRSDTSNSSFITPSHHLVTVGEWEPGPDGRGRLPILYTSGGDNELPGIVTEAGTDAAITPLPLIHHPPELTSALPADISSGEIHMTPADVDDFIARMTKQVMADD